MGHRKQSHAPSGGANNPRWARHAEEVSIERQASRRAKEAARESFLRMFMPQPTADESQGPSLPRPTMIAEPLPVRIRGKLPPIEPPLHPDLVRIIPIGSWQEYQSCSRKVTYKNRREAKLVAIRMASDGDSMESYLCSFCGKFHVGHPHHPKRPSLCEVKGCPFPWHVVGYQRGRYGGTHICLYHRRRFTELDRPILRVYLDSIQELRCRRGKRLNRSSGQTKSCYVEAQWRKRTAPYSILPTLNAHVWESSRPTRTASTSL